MRGIAIVIALTMSLSGCATWSGLTGQDRKVGYYEDIKKALEANLRPANEIVDDLLSADGSFLRSTGTTKFYCLNFSLCTKLLKRAHAAELANTKKMLANGVVLSELREKLLRNDPPKTDQNAWPDKEKREFSCARVPECKELVAKIEKEEAVAKEKNWKTAELKKSQEREARVQKRESTSCQLARLRLDICGLYKNKKLYELQIQTENEAGAISGYVDAKRLQVSGKAILFLKNQIEEYEEKYTSLARERFLVGICKIEVKSRGGGKTAVVGNIQLDQQKQQKCEVSFAH